MNKVIDVRPIVSFASRHVGSGPSRLRMVRLWHELGHDSGYSDPSVPTIMSG